MSLPRAVVAFTSHDGSTEIRFPTYGYEWESHQRFRAAEEPAVGADYAVDLFGIRAAPKEPGEERIRCYAVGESAEDLDAQVDALRATIARVGRGKLWVEDADGTRRWAWARPESLPEMTVTAANRRHVPLIVGFRRLSDWFAADPVMIHQRVTGQMHQFTLTNPGTAIVRQIVFTLRSRKSQGFSQPTITNQLTGEMFGTSRVAANASHVWRVDTGRLAVEYSTNGGSSWTNDYANFTTGTLQVGFLRLEPGANPIQVASSGSPDFDLEIEFWPAWH